MSKKAAWLFHKPQSDVDDSKSSNRRRFQRARFYISENVRAEVFGKSATLQGYCIDLSATGISILVEMKQPLSFVRNDLVQIVIHSTEGTSDPLNGKVANISEQQIQGKGYWRLQCEFAFPEVNEISNVRQMGVLIDLESFYQPLIRIEDNFRLYAMVHGRVVAFAKDGMKFKIKNVDCVMMPGITYKVTVQLSVGHSVITKAKVLSISPLHDSDEIEVCAKFLSLGLKDREMISQNFIMGSDLANPAFLKSKGFFVGSIEPAVVEMTYPTSKEEFNEMLKLRLKSYQGVGKFSDKSSPDEVWDQFDEISRHIVFKVRGKIIGTIRVVFCNKDYKLSEHYSWGVEIPKYVRDAGFVEVSRASIESSYRSSDIFASLIRHCMKLTIQSGAKYCLVSCNPHLVPLYKKLGAKVLVNRFAAMGRDDCALLAFDHRMIGAFSLGNIVAFNMTSYPLISWLIKRRTLSFLLYLPSYLFHFLIRSTILNFVRVLSYLKGVRGQK